MPLVPQANVTEAIEAIDNPKNTFSIKVRSLLLKFYAKSYYKSLRQSRKLQSLGKYFIAFGIAATLLGLDPMRYSMRFVAALIFCFFFLSFISSFFRKPSQLKIQRIVPDNVHQDVLFDYKIIVTNEHPSKHTPFLMIRDHGHIHFPTIYHWYRYASPIDQTLNSFDKFVGYPKWLYLVEQLQDVVAQEFSVPPLKPGASIEINAKGICHNRGERFFLGFMIAMPDPFGLLRRLWFAPSTNALVVIPKAKKFPLHIQYGSRTRQKGSSSSSQKTADAEEFRSLRLWRSGDPLKHIDWKATARSNQPISREFVPEFFQRTAIAIDNYAPTLIDELALDEAVSRSSALVNSFDRKEHKVDILFTEKTVFHLTLGAGSQDHLKALEAIASIQASKTDSIDLLEEQLHSQINQLSAIIFITPQWNDKRLNFCLNLLKKGINVSILICQPTQKNSKYPPGAQTLQLEYEQWD